MNEQNVLPLRRWPMLLSISFVVTAAIIGATRCPSDEIPANHIAIREDAPARNIALAQAPPANGAEKFRPRQVVPRFAPITKFPVVAVREVGDKLNPSELVLGVTAGKQSRAYPINMLTGPSREILNDTLNGHAIAATW